MFRCNFQDLGSVISGNLEVSFFQKFANPQSAQPVTPTSNIALRPMCISTTPLPPNGNDTFSIHVQLASFSNDVIKSSLLMCFAPLPFSRAGTPGWHPSSSHKNSAKDPTRKRLNDRVPVTFSKHLPILRPAYAPATNILTRL